MTEREKVLESLVRRAADELSYFNAHGAECEAHFVDCEICNSTDEADDHCTCFLALRRDLLESLPTPKTDEGSET